MKISAAYTALIACLDELLFQTCEDYSNNQRLKGDIDKAVLAVLRGRRFFCESVNLRLIDIDFKIQPLVPCSREFFPAMEKCAIPIREGYRTQNSTGGELCRYLIFYLITTTKNVAGLLMLNVLTLSFLTCPKTLVSVKKIVQNVSFLNNVAGCLYRLHVQNCIIIFVGKR